MFKSIIAGFFIGGIAGALIFDIDSLGLLGVLPSVGGAIGGFVAWWLWLDHQHSGIDQDELARTQRIGGQMTDQEGTAYRAVATSVPPPADTSRRGIDVSGDTRPMNYYPSMKDREALVEFDRELEAGLGPNTMVQVEAAAGNALRSAADVGRHVEGRPLPENLQLVADLVRYIRDAYDSGGPSGPNNAYSPAELVKAFSVAWHKLDQADRDWFLTGPASKATHIAAGHALLKHGRTEADQAEGADMLRKVRPDSRFLGVQR